MKQKKRKNKLKKTYMFLGDKFDLKYDPLVNYFKWDKPKYWNKCSFKEQKIANQRSISHYEIVLSCKTKFSFFKLRELLRDGEYYSFETLKGGDIHIFCFVMSSTQKKRKENPKYCLNQDDRNMIRRMWWKASMYNLKQFYISFDKDIELIEEDQLIARELYPFSNSKKTKNYLGHNVGECMLCDFMNKAWPYGISRIRDMYQKKHKY